MKYISRLLHNVREEIDGISYKYRTAYDNNISVQCRLMQINVFFSLSYRIIACASFDISKWDQMFIVRGCVNIYWSIV